MISYGTTSIQEFWDDGKIYADMVTIRNDGFTYVYADNSFSQPECAGGYVGPDVNAILMPGDWDGDGYADWIYRASDGGLHRMPGWSGGTSRNQIGWGWNIMTALTSPGAGTATAPQMCSPEMAAEFCGCTEVTGMATGFLGAHRSAGVGTS